MHGCRVGEATNRGPGITEHTFKLVTHNLNDIAGKAANATKTRADVYAWQEVDVCVDELNAVKDLVSSAGYHMHTSRPDQVKRADGQQRTKICRVGIAVPNGVSAYALQCEQADLVALHDSGRWMERMIPIQGGDEFVILLEKVDGTPADVRRFGDHVIEVLSRPYPWEGQILRISASIGHARYPLHAESQSKTLGLADQALYVAKEAGKGCCVTHGERPVAKPKRKKPRFVLKPEPHTRFVEG